jgi:hypothetical protein
MPRAPRAAQRRVRLAYRVVCISLLPALAFGAVVVLVALQAANARPMAHARQGDALVSLGSGTARVGGDSLTASNLSGQAMPTGNPSGWREVFSYNFAKSPSVRVGGFSGCVDDGSIMASHCSGLPGPVAQKLWAYPDGWHDDEFGIYEPSQVLSIHNGVLDYYLHTSGSTHMVAAVVPKIPRGVRGGGLRYGAYAVRFKSDLLPGYKTAFLLWPDSNKWPADGEIDFPEGDLNGLITASMHWMGGTSHASKDTFLTQSTYSTWHTAVIEWTPHLCRFILDGRIIGTSYRAIPSGPMHWVLQAETSGEFVPARTVAGHIYVAWITAYVRRG